MKLKITIIITLVITTLQWLIIGGFVSHSYMWLLKANAPIIDAGITMTTLWLIVTILSFGYSCWAYDKLHQGKSKLRFAALLSAQLGLSGLLVFWGYGKRWSYYNGSSLMCQPNPSIKRDVLMCAPDINKR